MKQSLPSAARAAGARKTVAGARPAPARKAAAQPDKSRSKPVAKAATAAKPPSPPKPDRRRPVASAAGPKRKQPKSSKKIEVRLLIDDLARMDALKQRAAAAGRRSKRSELVRAGLVLLQGLDPVSLCDTLEALPVRRKAKSMLLPSLVEATGKKNKRPAR